MQPDHTYAEYHGRTTVARALWRSEPLPTTASPQDPVDQNGEDDNQPDDWNDPEPAAPRPVDLQIVE